MLTEKYLHKDYNKLVHEVVVRLWKGKDAKSYYELVDSIEYMKGVKELFSFVKRNGYITAIISASSIDVARRVQHDFGVNHLFANELVIKNGKVSGEFVWPIGAGKEKKAKIVSDLCEELGISLKECIYVGDSETDLEALEIVGQAIAFNCRAAKVKEAADVVVESDDLRDLIKHIL